MATDRMFDSSSFISECAESHTERPAMSSACPSLLASQNSDGGWGYRAHSQSSVEASAWALLALASLGKNSVPPVPPEAASGLHWLRGAQLPDGSWPQFADQQRGCWATSLACLALRAHGESDDCVQSGLRWLLETVPADGTFGWRARRFFFARSVVRQDSSLSGWGWVPGTASWVEPTSYALLLLRWFADKLDRSAKRRRSVAERMLYDRMCPGGGWNSGNPLVYGVAGEPRIGPTVWALLALHDHAESPENRTSVDWLERTCEDIRGPGSLALAYLCLAAYGRTAPPLVPTLQSMYLNNQFLGNTLVFAWAIMAGAGAHVLIGNQSRDRERVTAKIGPGY